MELQIKQAILKYFKNCIEEDSKESLKINLDNSKSNIYFSLGKDESFDIKNYHLGVLYKFLFIFITFFGINLVNF